MGKKVVVVGGGVIGASIAYHLAQADANVCVIEKALPASGASSKSYGWINANLVASPEYYRLRRAAIDEYSALATQLNLEGILQQNGSLWWEEGDISKHAKDMNAFGYGVEIIDGDTFAELEPNIGTPPEKSILSRIERAADGVKLTEAFLNTAAKTGADLIYGCAVEGFIKKGDRIIGVNTSFGPVHADTVVVAAGAWAQDLLASTGVVLPMDNKQGIIVHTLPIAPMIKHMIMSPDIHFRQDTTGRIIMGEIFSGCGLDEERGETPVTFAKKMLERLKLRLPAAKGLVIGNIMAGMRPVPVDGFPVLGAPDNVQGLYLASMHSGITLAPIVGCVVTEEIIKGEDAELLNDFRPSRF